MLFMQIILTGYTFRMDTNYDTANNFINVYKRLFGHQELVEKVKSSILYKISAPSFPEELTEYLLSRGGLREITNKKLDELVKLYREEGLDAIEPIFEKVAENNIRYEHAT